MCVTVTVIVNGKKCSGILLCTLSMFGVYVKYIAMYYQIHKVSLCNRGDTC